MASLQVILKYNINIIFQKELSCGVKDFLNIKRSTQIKIDVHNNMSTYSYSVYT